MYNDLTYQLAGAERGSVCDISKDVMVYIDGEPDFGSYDFMINASDRKGMAIFREFARKMKEHFKTLS
jgi:hypothetical protein